MILEEPYYFIHEVLSNEQSAFMMPIVCEMLAANMFAAS
jgi:hypothetical protein